MVQQSKSGWLILYVALFALAVLFQLASGAWTSDLGGHPDEAAHFVTGLMIRDYLVTGLPSNPMAFARSYYEQYPKVALGHYPPVFYLVESGWLLVFGPSQRAALLLQCALSAGFGSVCAWIVRRTSPYPTLSFLAGIWVVALPQVQSSATLIMSDILLSLFCLLAAVVWGRVLRGPTWWNAVTFGFLASAAILTKGGGLLLALLPPLTLLATRRFSLLRDIRFWAAGIPVVLLCVPWMAATYKITEEGMASSPFLPYVAQAGPYYLSRLVQVFGVLLLPALAGLLSLPAWCNDQKNPNASIALAVSGLLPATLLFYILIPSGTDPRYLLAATPAVVLLAAEGLRRMIAPLYIRNPKAATVGISVAALVILGSFALLKDGPIAHKNVSGFGEAVRIVGLTAEAKPNALIASDARGEGAFVAGLAASERSRLVQSVRATKLLADTDWLGRDYQAKAHSKEELAALLLDSRIDLVILDDMVPAEGATTHVALLRETMIDQSLGYRPLARIDAVRGLEKGTLSLFVRKDF